MTQHFRNLEFSWKIFLGLWPLLLLAALLILALPAGKRTGAWKTYSIVFIASHLAVVWLITHTWNLTIRWDVLLLVWSLFLLSALLIGLRPSENKPLMWKKYFVYLLIVHVVFAGIASGNFEILAIVIFVGAFDEIWGLQHPEKKVARWKKIAALAVISFLGFGFIFFAAKMPDDYLWMIYAAIIIFDGISQLAGQSIGRTHFIKKISPNKTLEGFLVGWLFCFGTFVLLGPRSTADLLVYACVGPVALAGDLLASFYKRIYGVKDYGTWIPGHGGMLDRFDSLLLTGAAFFYLGIVVFAFATD